MDDKKLFLLDAYALIYRAYYALIRAPRVTSGGFNTSAIFGFVNTLDEILRKENPSHIAVCFDPKGDTFRHEAYPEYKAKRDAQPEDITLSIPYIKRIIEAYNIPAVEVPGYEADDVIGTLSRMAEAEGFTTYMMTPDKDYGQLVTPRILMYRPALKGQGFEIRGVAEVCERYGISSPRQVIDLLALEGDAIDNIPGCPGVGEKTAVKLISEYGSVENLIDNVSQLKGALRKKVEENIEQIRFSKFLATIKTDVPVDISVDSLVRRPENIDSLREIFTELEFRTFLNRLSRRSDAPSAGASSSAVHKESSSALPFGGPGSLFDFAEAADLTPVSDQTSSDARSESMDFSAVSDIEDVKKLIGEAMSLSRVGLSLYAVGAEAMTAQLRAVAIALSPSSTRVIILPEQLDPLLPSFIDAIRPLFASCVTIVSHDVKRELIILRRLGIEWSAPYIDTSVAHYLIQPEMKHTLPEVAASVISYHTSDYSTELRLRLTYSRRTDDDIVESYGEISAVSLRLADALLPMLEEQGMKKLFDEVELPMVRVLASMEFEGVRIDVPELHEQSRHLTARVESLEAEVYVLAGTRFNISSPAQVGEILFDRLAIAPDAKRTKKGFYSTTEEILEKYRNRHPIVDLILKIRALRKLLATYINALPALINPSTGKIHTTYNQTVTATGRISSTNPNLQNIPVRTDDGREIRKAFIPDKGCLMLSADYSQIELRLMADMSRDHDMVEAFLSGEDIHRATAAKIYHLPISEVSDTQRRNAKTANFGIIYGISAFGLSERLSIPRGEAKALIEGYLDTYPHVRDFIQDSIERARRDGYVTTVLSRRRYLPEINSRNAVVRGYAERNAVNAPLQGSAADIIKTAMVRIFDRMKRENFRSTMIMQVHDELIFNVIPDELAHLQQLVTEEMEHAYKGLVPLTVSSGVGENWLEAH